MKRANTINETNRPPPIINSPILKPNKLIPTKGLLNTNNTPIKNNGLSPIMSLVNFIKYI